VRWYPTLRQKTAEEWATHPSLLVQ